MPRSIVTLEFDGNPVGEGNRFNRIVRGTRTLNPSPAKLHQKAVRDSIVL
jgi:hypothetical protein